jgi:hypothetical protein
MRELLQQVEMRLFFYDCDLQDVLFQLSYRYEHFVLPLRQTRVTRGVVRCDQGEILLPD